MTGVSRIDRNPVTAAQARHDLIIVGGGVYGVMLALEAGRRGKRALLLERDDFGGATSRNHLRTLHGGLRYLQSLDVPRFFESVGERRWFLSRLPALARVLPCLMPLYGRGLMRPAVMGPALLLNDTLGACRNRGVSGERRLPMGRLVGRGRTLELFPQAERRGLQGAALWYDAAMPEHQRLLMELLRWACSLGAGALNYVEAENLLRHDERVAGVLALDRLSGQRLEFRAPLVVNAAGPWCRELAQKFDQDQPRLMRRRLLLFNVLFRRKALSECALALTPRRGPSHTYFVHSWQGRMLAGTGEVLLDDERSAAEPRPEEIAAFIADLNDAVPELSIQEGDIEAVYAGILPATAAGRLAAREVILNHGAVQGPMGLYSVSGVKYTTSRLVAAKAMKRIFPSAKPRPLAPPEAANSGRWFFAYDWEPPPGWSAESLRELVEEEAIVHLDDLLFRRSGLGENARRARELLPRLRPLFSWSDLRWQQECERVLSRLRGRA